MLFLRNSAERCSRVFILSTGGFKPLRSKVYQRLKLGALQLPCISFFFNQCCKIDLSSNFPAANSWSTFCHTVNKHHQCFFSPKKDFHRIEVAPVSLSSFASPSCQHCRSTTPLFSKGLLRLCPNSFLFFLSCTNPSSSPDLWFWAVKFPVYSILPYHSIGKKISLLRLLWIMFFYSISFQKV